MVVGGDLARAVCARYERVRVGVHKNNIANDGACGQQNSVKVWILALCRDFQAALTVGDKGLRRESRWVVMNWGGAFGALTRGVSGEVVAASVTVARMGA